MIASRRILVAVSLPAVLIVAIGLAAGLWETPARLFSGTSAVLSSTSVALPTVIVGGLVDAIHPCAFTVLLLFVTAVVSMYRNVESVSSGAVRARLLLYGGVFIFAIFLTYLSVGVGLFRVSTALTQYHVGARLGALAAVFLGLWMIKDYFFRGWGPRLGAPAALGYLVQDWGRRATLGSMFGLGFLVGLCTVPCSGAVYLAVLSMLALQKSFLQSYLYLVLYNIMYVVPLVVILAVASARPALNRLAHWNLHYKEWVRLALGSAVVTLGLAILAMV